jgi:hypothetical protein
MSYSFMRPALPDRTYGLVMPLNVMTEKAKEASVSYVPSPRVELLTTELSASRLGKDNAGIVKMSLGLLKNHQLTLVEEAVLAVQDNQRLHIRHHSNQQRNFSHLVAGGFNAWNETSPYDYIVESVAGTFRRPALIAIRDFFKAHNNMGELINLCSIMDQQGIELTKKNVSVQLTALHEAMRGRSRMDAFDHPYLSHPELIRAVHDYPTRIHDLIDMLRTRGNVKAAAEVFGSSKAISVGAL